MEMFQDTQALFCQLRAAPEPQAVKTLIENHDAWSHSDAIESLAAWTRPLPAEPARRARILEQRHSLESLVTRLPVRFATAG